ncbi:lipase family protein [Amycolatopsis sp. NBC_01488]|uniref:lipase family protein n=1 Tax=Amycolatopsis sp. NBC_01488 TaxID=2903563 RepID=UPI002E2E1377|nr:lipase family protein [Amycolatopsis sp. NBC_01488]
MRRSAVTCLLSLAALVAAVVAPTAASAAPADFYQPPSPLPAGPPGAIIRTQPMPALATALTATATTVMYHSRDARNADIAVTGTVFTPRLPWLGAGSRPWVDLAVGTQGLGPQCAPSKQFATSTEQELEPVSLLLARGWGVVVIDYEGYTTGSTPTYVAGVSEAHSVLDMARAAASVPGTGISPATRWATMGYSQGGGASSWAASLAPAYAPDLQLITDVSGGVPADIANVAESLDGSLIGEGLQLYALIGLQQAYPGRFPLDDSLSVAGKATEAALKTQCVVQTLAGFPLKKFSDYSTGETIRQFDARPDVAAVYAENNLTTRPAPTVPVFQYHAALDEIVPLGQAQALNRAWCSAGVRTVFALVPGDHIAGETAGLPTALAWLGDRFAGRPAPTTCS